MKNDLSLADAIMSKADYVSLADHITVLSALLAILGRGKIVVKWEELEKAALRIDAGNGEYCWIFDEEKEEVTFYLEEKENVN